MATYPKREKFFANRFIRLLVKCCVANEIGTDAAYLLTVIAMTEDASHYKRGVFFYDEQLKPLIGVNSSSMMTRIRKRAVDAGWLHFKAGHKGQCSTYWVTIPKHTEGLDDMPTDEGGHELGVTGETNRNRIRIESEAKENSNGSASGVILPIPNPIPNPVGSAPVTREEKAADLANHYWMEATGRRRLSQEDLRVEFAEKLRVYGDSRYELILTKIKDKGRDRTQHLWQFWRLCELGDAPPPQTKPVRAPDGRVEAFLAKQEEAERQWQARKGIKAGGVPQKGGDHAA